MKTEVMVTWTIESWGRGDIQKNKDESRRPESLQVFDDPVGELLRIEANLHHEKK